MSCDFHFIIWRWLIFFLSKKQKAFRFFCFDIFALDDRSIHKSGLLVCFCFTKKRMNSKIYIFAKKKKLKNSNKFHHFCRFTSFPSLNQKDISLLDTKSHDTVHHHNQNNNKSIKTIQIIKWLCILHRNPKKIVL